MIPEYVTDWEHAKFFFKDFNIPYEPVKTDEDTDRLCVKNLRDEDLDRMSEAIFLLNEAGLDKIVDHCMCFRDADDNTVCTFNPSVYMDIPKDAEYLVLSVYSLRGKKTYTYVKICKCELQKSNTH